MTWILIYYFVSQIKFTEEKKYKVDKIEVNIRHQTQSNDTKYRQVHNIIVKYSNN